MVEDDGLLPASTSESLMTLVRDLDELKFVSGEGLNLISIFLVEDNPVCQSNCD